MPKTFENEQEYALERLINPTRSAEGPILPNPQRGAFRVPFVANLELARTQTYNGGTQFTLLWLDPESVDRRAISHYNIYVRGLYDANRTPQGPWTAQGSPAEIRVDARDVVNVTLIVQTVLTNGQVSNLDASPAVSGQTSSQSAVFGDLITGANGLITDNRVVLVDAVGGVKQSANLTDDGSIFNIDEGIKLKRVTITFPDSPYVLPSNLVTLVCDTSGGAIIVNLPAISGQENRVIEIKRAGANQVTVNPDGAETIESTTDAILNIDKMSLTFTNDGTSDWLVI